jgi:hypothetical protein
VQQYHKIPEDKRGKKRRYRMLDACPCEGLSSRLDPDVDRAEKRKEQIGKPENQKTPVEARAQFDDDEYQAHRQKERTHDFEREIEHRKTATSRGRRKGW